MKISVNHIQLIGCIAMMWIGLQASAQVDSAVASLPDALDAVEGALVEDDYTWWMQHQTQLQSQFDEEWLDVDPTRISRFLFSPWKDELPQLPELDSLQRMKANWSLIRALHMQKNSMLESELLPSDALEPFSPAQNLYLGWLPALTVFILAIILWIFSSRKAQSLANTDNYENPHIQRIVQSLGQKHSNKMLTLELALFEFNSGLSPFENALNDASNWHRLSNNQKLIVHLLHRNLSNDAIIEHLGISRGHFYNERSNIRKALQLDAQEDIVRQISGMIP